MTKHSPSNQTARLTAAAFALASAAAFGQTPLDDAQLEQLNAAVIPQAAIAVGAATMEMARGQVSRAMDGGGVPPKDDVVVVTGQERRSTLGAAALWAQGYAQEHEFERAWNGADSAARTVALEGEARGALIGMEVGSGGGKVLLGMALGQSETELDFEIGNGTEQTLMGAHKTRLDGLRPYFGYRANNGLRLWGALGVDRGPLEIEQKDASQNTLLEHEIDMEVLSAAAGFFYPLALAGNPGGEWFSRAGLVGDAVLTKATDEDDNPAAAPFKYEAGRARLGAEFYRYASGEGGSLTSRLDVMLRHELGDDALAGNGVEMGGDLAWRLFSSGLSIGVGGRWLLAHADETIKEVGVGGGVVWSGRGEDDSGLSVAYGRQWNAMPQAAGFAGDAEAAPMHGWRVKYGLGLIGETEFLILSARGHDFATTTVGADYKLGDALTAGYEYSPQAADHHGYLRYQWGFE